MYKGTAIHTLTNKDIGKPFERIHPAYADWGNVSPSDVGKQMILDNGIGSLESAAQRDERRRTADVETQALDVCRRLVNWLDAVHAGHIRADESTVKIIESIAGEDARAVIRKAGGR